MKLYELRKKLNSYEELMAQRSPSLDEAVPEALPEDEEEPFWSDFEDPEGPLEKLAKEKLEGAKDHQRWKADQDKTLEVRNYHGPDNDANGSLNW